MRRLLVPAIATLLSPLAFGQDTLTGETPEGRASVAARPSAVERQRPSSASKLPASSRSLTEVRKRAASAPSIRRWSYDMAR